MSEILAPIANTTVPLSAESLVTGTLNKLEVISLASVKNKLKILADAAKYDASCASSGSYRKREAGGMGNTEGMGICHSYTPDGRCVSLLKILMTNYCIYDCKFCINRISSDVKRARFTPKEIAWLTLEFYRRNYIEGLFLSSGIIDSSDSTMEQLIVTARLLRQEHKFGGYIHLKVVAGASQELVERAGLWADRISVNIEMPTQNDLDLLAPAKKIETAQESMDQIKSKIVETKEDSKKFKFTPKFAPAGQTTQMIVGATGTDDATFLQKSEGLYHGLGLRRIYYSAYSPITNADAILPTAQPMLVRENRLYQADWLMRFYGFKSEEIADSANPNLPLDIDPKTHWALRNRHFFPVDVNTSPKSALLRIPGLGVKNVDKIIEARKFGRLRVDDLRRLRIMWNRARYFLTALDHNPDAMLIDRVSLDTLLRPKSQQLSLFGDSEPVDNSPSAPEVPANVGAS